MKFRNLLIIILALGVYTKSLAGMLNRNLLEVDQQVYTQRDFEVYILVKEALFLKKGIPPSLVSSETWIRGLEIYKNEMLINGLFNQEAQRLNS